MTSTLSRIEAAAAVRLINAAPREFGRDFNKLPFQFSHNLAGNPLFRLERLSQLAEKLLADKSSRSLRWQAAGAPVDAGWDVPLHKKLESVKDAIANLQESGSWVLLYSVQRDPEYRKLLDELMAEIVDITGADPRGITWEDAYVFMASPGAVTPYHVDHEATFLFQVDGNRIANIWDPNDRTVLSEKEIEAYYFGDLNAAKYKEEVQSKAHVYNLDKGTGVHHPSRAPHWFKNRDHYSIALGVHFCVRECDSEAAPYQINYLLRRLGVSPSAPGQSAKTGRLKSSIVATFSDKKPKDKNSLLRSGILRMTSPFRVARKLVRIK